MDIDIEVGWRFVDLSHIENIQSLMWIYKVTKTPTNISIKWSYGHMVLVCACGVMWH